jgi:hypothetical protein
MVNRDHSEGRLRGVSTYTGAEVIGTKDNPIMMKTGAGGQPTNLFTHLLFTHTNAHTSAHNGHTPPAG